MARYIGNYEVVSELGAGHFGSVYLAVGEVPGRGAQAGRRRLVAVKKLKDAADPESTALLLQEFALLEQVKHRSVVRVFEYLDDENAVVMEYIHGVTLKRMFDELARAHEQVFTEAAIEIGCEMADALYQAYTTPGDNGEPLQLVHRDLKPANVILTPAGEVKILDWGLARVDNADFDKENAERVKGTLMYMAPEQARGLEVDHRTDLFALGLILYELLVSRPVYGVNAKAADPLREVMGRIEAGETATHCRELEARLPAVGSIVTRALQARPKDRYQHGHDLLVDLRRQLYRDRGAYLQEFCEFFFGAICALGPAPTLESVGASGRAAPRSKMSIEEKLRQSMDREARAKEGARAAPRTAPGRQPPPQGGTKQEAAPVPANGPGAEGAKMATPPSGRKPAAPPVGGGASRATPFAPAAKDPAPRAKAPKSIGERRPDETGMLEMVPLGHDADESEVQGDPSATSFFAIPAPKGERAKAAPGGAPPPPVAMAGMGAPPPAAPPVARPPFGVGPPGPMGVGGAPPPPQPLVQGPVASYGGSAQAASPFQVSGPSMAPPAEAGQRVQSNRVYAILFGVFLMVCAAVFVAVWFKPSGDDSAATAAAPEKVVADAKPAKKKAAPVDTGGAAEEEAPKAKAPKTKASSTSSGTTKAQAAPPRSTSPGPVSVRLADAGGASSIEIGCPSGFRKRSALSGGSGTVGDVPQENCTLYFKGGAPAKFAPVHGGMSLSCNIVGTTADCR